MTTLKDYIDDFYLLTREDHSEFRNCERTTIIKYCNEALKKLNLTFWKNTVGWTVKVPERLSVSKPQDLELFIRAYVFDCTGKTIELNINPQVPNEIRNYLVDCDGSILSDKCNGDIYTECLQCNEETRQECDVCCGTGKCKDPYLEKLYGDTFKYKDSYVRETKNGFEFSYDLEGMVVMIEYIGNGMMASEPCNVKIDPRYEEVIDYFVKFKLLEPMDGMFAKSQYYKSEYTRKKRLLAIEQNPLTLNDLEFISYLKTL